MTEEVLLLDDDQTALSVLEGVLEGAGFRCVLSQDAAAALTQVVERPQIAVVVSDILMPQVSGLQFVQQLQALTLGRMPPRVLLLTAAPTIEGAVEALRLGVRDFLVKPIRPVELVAAVQRAMDQARADRAADAARTPDVAQLMRQAEELVSCLRRLAHVGEEAHEGAVHGELPPPAPPGETSPNAARPAAAQTAKLTVLDTIEQLRRLRSRHAHHGLDDVAWDLLLELLRAERLRQRLSVSGLAISVRGVSTTTSLRRIHELAARDYIERIPDPDDARRDFVVLTARSQQLLAEYLAEANTCVSILAN